MDSAFSEASVAWTRVVERLLIVFSLLKLVATWVASSRVR